MASIILSFVGNQDPFSGDSNQEGSIVSLVKHLVLQKDREIKQIFLLATDGTLAGAKDTQEWLHSEFNLAIESIKLIQVDEALSQDPIDVLLATNAAKQVLTTAKNIATQGDVLEFNASSGTPAMKSTWSILQSAGYAPHSRVWQVRNPKLMQPEQERVFATDLSGLKREFDRNIIQQQLADYNYSGALATIKDSGLNNELVTALLNYGHRRSSFDFDRAQDAISEHKKNLTNYLYAEIADLRRKDLASLLKELYFGADIKVKNQNYSDFLTIVSQFQENLLRLLMTNIGLKPPVEYKDIKPFWIEVRKFDDGNLYRQLVKDNIATDSWIYVKGMNKIVEYTDKYQDVLKESDRLRKYCEDRNNYIHKLQGVSQLDNADAILNDLKKILKKLTPMPDTNTFDRLNQDILNQLAFDR